MALRDVDLYGRAAHHDGSKRAGRRVHFPVRYLRPVQRVGEEGRLHRSATDVKQDRLCWLSHGVPRKLPSEGDDDAGLRHSKGRSNPQVRKVQVGAAVPHAGRVDTSISALHTRLASLNSLASARPLKTPNIPTAVGFLNSSVMDSPMTRVGSPLG